MRGICKKASKDMGELRNMLGKAAITDDGNALTISYEDYGVDSCGGGDYEVTYTLSKENRLKLYEKLTDAGYFGSLSDMIKECFGLSFEKESFSDYCSRNNIDFDRHIWIS